MTLIDNIYNNNDVFNSIRKKYNLLIRKDQIESKGYVDPIIDVYAVLLKSGNEILVSSSHCLCEVMGNYEEETFDNIIGYKPINYKRSILMTPSIRDVKLGYIEKLLIDSIFLKNEVYCKEFPNYNPFYFIKYAIAELPIKLFEKYPQKNGNKLKLIDLINNAYREYANAFVDLHKNKLTGNDIKIVEKYFNKELKEINNTIYCIYDKIDKNKNTMKKHLKI